MSSRYAIAAAFLAALLLVAFAFIRRHDSAPRERGVATGPTESPVGEARQNRRARQAAYTAILAGVIASLLLLGRAAPASPSPADGGGVSSMTADGTAFSGELPVGAEAFNETLGLPGFLEEIAGVEATAVSAATAKTYYVDAVNGADSKAGTSESTAWKTLGKASSAVLLPGDRLLLKRGQTWSGQLTMAESGTPQLPVYVGGYGAGTPPLIGEGSNCVKISGSYVRVQGLRLDNCGWAGIQFAEGAAFNLVMGNYMSHNVAGVHVDGGATNNRVLGNVISENTKMSRLTADPTNDDSGAFGVLLTGDSTEVAYNTISGSDTFSYDYGRDGAAVEVYGGQFNHVHHNLAYDNDAFTELGNPRSLSNFFSYNVVRSSLETSTFVVTKGAQSSLGPIKATRLYNNTVRFTGAQSQGFVCSSGCTREILYLRNNVIEAVWKTGYADGPIDEDSNLYYGGQRQFQLGANSVVADPRFADPQRGDLRVRSGSVAIDTGVYAPYQKDFGGQAVPQDGNGDGGAIRDRGAFEFTPASASGTTPTPAPTPGATASATPTPKPSATATATPTPTPVPTATPLPARNGSMTATAETDPVPNSGDAADDPAIWVNAANPALSTVIGTNKLGGLAVYDLSGRQLHYYTGIKPNNVDVRYGFSLGGTPVDIVTASETDSDTILVYRVDPASRGLVSVRAQARGTGFGVSGLCMYKSPSSGKLFVFVSDSSGNVKQFELFASGSAIDYTLVRTLSFGSMTEGCVADDYHRAVYISEEDVALWRLSAEPGGGSAKTQVAAVDGSVLTADLEGLAISDKGNGTGHLIASSQGSDDFALFDRQTGAYKGRFEVVAGAVDAVSHTDGIDLVSVPLGPSFPSGTFVAQDDSNPGGNQNFKLVPWNAAAP